MSVANELRGMTYLGVPVTTLIGMAEERRRMEAEAKPELKALLEPIPFWKVCLELRMYAGACEEGITFLKKRQPMSLDEAWKLLVAGVERAHKRDRSESAYAGALRTWTHWMMQKLDKHKDPRTNCPECWADVCPTCGRDSSDDDEEEEDEDNVEKLVKFLAKHPNPPFTEQDIRERHAYLVEHPEEWESEDDEEEDGLDDEDRDFGGPPGQEDKIKQKKSKKDRRR